MLRSNIFVKAIGTALLLVCLSGQTLAAAKAAETASLNMRDVDIRTLVDAVADITGKNFLLDPRVKGNVTVVSARPMAKDALYDVFLSILQVHGYAAIPSGRVIKIVPDSSAKQNAVVGAATRGVDELITQVIPVRNVAAAELVPVLRPLMPQQSHLQAHVSSNTLIVLDRASNVARLERIIGRIDRGAGEDIEVIRLNHAAANEVVRIVSGLLTGVPAGKSDVRKPTLAADERTNSVLLSGDPAARLQIRGLIAHLDTPLEAEGSAQVVFLKYAKAKELATLLQGTVASGGKGSGLRRGGGNEPVSIQADEYNNALIISGPPDVARELKAVIRQLDIRRAQVLVEAVIAEVSTDLSHELGVQVGVGPRDGQVNGPVGITNLGPSGKSIASIGQSIISQTLTLSNGGYIGLGNFSGNGNAWAVLVNALSGDAATNILSTPTLLATDNREAQIVVGQNVPFITGQYTNTGTAGTSVANPFQTIERRDIGITLTVKPQINEGSSIQLELEQEVSSLSTTSASASDLITNKRSIKTSVTVEDGQIIVLGGLIEDTYKDSKQKVPLLGDVPVLGNLFRYDSSTKVKKNLMVFLRPVILRDAALASSYSGQKYSYLRSRQLEADIQGRQQVGEGAAQLPANIEALFNPPSRPVMPEGAVRRPEVDADPQQ